MSENKEVMDESVETEGQGEVDASDSQESQGRETEETPRSASADEAEGQADKVEQQKMDWEKSYKHLQSKYTKDSQRLKQFERDFESYKQKLDVYDQLERLIETNPRVLEAMKAAMQSNGMDPELAENQVYKALAPQMEEIKEIKSYIQEQQQREIKSKAENIVSSAENDAKSLYKSVFGKEMGNEQMIKVIEWMQENRVYNGKLAVKDLFFEDARSHNAQSALEANKAKKAIGTTRTQIMNGAAAQKPQTYSTFKEAWKAAREELGMDTSKF